MARSIGLSASGIEHQVLPRRRSGRSDRSRKDAARYAGADPWRCSALAAVSPLIETPNQPGTNPERFDCDAIDGPGQIEWPGRRSSLWTTKASCARLAPPPPLNQHRCELCLRRCKMSSGSTLTSARPLPSVCRDARPNGLSRLPIEDK